MRVEYLRQDGRISEAVLGPNRALGTDKDTGESVGLVALANGRWVEIPRQMDPEESEYIHRRSLGQYPNNAGYAAIFEHGYRTALTEERFGRNP